MFIQTKVIQVKEGHAQTLVEKFSKPGAVEQSAGFIDLSILVKKVRKGDEEIIILVRWESEEAWKGWERSEAHLAGHRNSRDQPKPDYVLGSSHGNYEVMAVKTAPSVSE